MQLEGTGVLPISTQKPGGSARRGQSTHARAPPPWYGGQLGGKFRGWGPSQCDWHVKVCQFSQASCLAVFISSPSAVLGLGVWASAI